MSLAPCDVHNPLNTPEPALHALFATLHGPDAEAAADDLRRRAAAANAQVVVVSACLLGERTRYDGGDKYQATVIEPLLHDPD